MTDNDIIIEVARLDGLEPYGFPMQQTGSEVVYNRPGWVRREAGNNKLIEVKEPHYLHSRDAIIPVVQKLSPLQLTQFVDFLCEIVLPDKNEEYDGSDYISQTWCGYLITASPRQLCIALVKLAGKWRESTSSQPPEPAQE